MFSPEGVLLCTISHKKANWYLTRNIAGIFKNYFFNIIFINSFFKEKISDEPLHIRLKFQPKGKGHADDPYYISEKQNCCVVCGFDENFLRFSIVPHGFKKHFEEILKSRDSHDIILLCQKCLEKANLGSSRLKETLSKELQIPLEGIGAKFDLDKDLAKVKMAASALKLSQNLPQSRREELESILKKHLGKETITVEDIESLASTSVKSARSDFIPFEQAVVERIKKEGKVVEFVRRWRENFVKTMKPKFLPKYWSIDHPLNIEREEYILKSSK